MTKLVYALAALAALTVAANAVPASRVVSHSMVTKTGDGRCGTPGNTRCECLTSDEKARRMFNC